MKTIRGLVLLASLIIALSVAVADEEWPYGYVANDEPFDRATMPADAMIEIYRRRMGSNEWWHAYVPKSWTSAPHKDAGEFCYKIRAVDGQKQPLTFFSSEACQIKGPTGLNVSR